MPDVTVRPMKEDERERAAVLVAKVFSGGVNQHYRNLYRHWLYDLPQHPHESAENVHIALVKRQIVSLVRVSFYPLRYGNATLRVACFGSMCTAEGYRQQGIAEAVIRDALTYVAEQGAHIALLHGIPHYFDTFGFMSVLPKYMLHVNVADALQQQKGLRIRKAEAMDMPQVARLYERHWGHRVAFRRSPDLWMWRYEHGTGQVVVAIDAQEKVEGYIWHDNSLSSAVEVVADTPLAVSTLLYYDAKRWQQTADELTWSLPPDDVMVSYLQAMLPMTLSAHYDPVGGWMARVIDSHRLLQHLLPEIKAQAQSMSSQFDPTQLVLRIEASDSVVIGMENEPDTFCTLSLRDFVQVMFSTLRPATLALRHPLSLESQRLLELLFPPRSAAIGAWDWF